MTPLTDKTRLALYTQLCQTLEDLGYLAPTNQEITIGSAVLGLAGRDILLGVVVQPITHNFVRVLARPFDQIPARPTPNAWSPFVFDLSTIREVRRMPWG
jgi:hypothetical protein